MENTTSDPPLEHKDASVATTTQHGLRELSHDSDSSQNRDLAFHSNVGNNTLVSTPKLDMKKKPPYDWQFLPQEVLERIAYNSRKQRRARLRANPPKCPNCPDVHLTSMSMLSTHLLSKKHLARAKKQMEQDSVMPVISSLESSCQDSTSGTQSRITSDRSDINDVHPRASEEKRFSKDSSLKDVDITLTTDRSCPGLVKENKLVSMSNSSREPVSEPKEKSAKQRKRKAERDRKKAKSRLKKLAIADEQMALDTAPEILHMQEDRGILRQDIINSSSKTKRKRTRNRKSRILDESNSLDPTTETKNATKTRRAMEPSSGASLPTQGRSQFKWNCSICGQQWKQKKAWNGHLLSAQHMRRVLQTMQKTMSPIAPYGCEDVQASKDMFGWGTAVGMVEEEEEEDEESEDEVLAAVDEMPANLEVIDHSSDDDMDLEE